MTRKSILIVLISLLALLVGVFAFAYVRVVGFRSLTGTYRNSKYRYSLLIPSGWRLATFLMLFLNGAKFGNTPTTDASVVVTRMSPGDEWKAAEEVNSDISNGSLPSYSEFLSGGILIEAEQANLDPETLRFPSSTSLQNIERIQTPTGLSGWRYDIVENDDPTDRITVAYFPYPAGALDSAQGISFRVINDGGLDDETFDDLYASLSYQTSSASL